jgi:hypothetical protein
MKGGELIVAPKVYEIGVDLTRERYDEVVQALGEWFKATRVTKEPFAAAKHSMDCCLLGVKVADGKTPIKGKMAASSWEARVRSVCRYDPEKMQGIETHYAVREQRRAERIAMENELRERQPTITEASLRRVRQASYRTHKKEKEYDANYPEEYRRPKPEDATYGDDPLVFFTFQEIEDRDRMKAAYLEQFPQLNNVAAMPKLDQLLDLVVIQKRLRFRNAQAGEKNTVRATEKEMSDMIKQVVDLEKAMGIDPVTVAKTQREKEGGSIGDAVRRFESLPDWREIRLREWVEELLMIYVMFMRRSPRSDTSGYQLDEVGLYGLTKSRVVECPQCGTKNFAGLRIAEIESWLVANGYLKPKQHLAVDAGR